MSQIPSKKVPVRLIRELMAILDPETTEDTMLVVIPFTASLWGFEGLQLTTGEVGGFEGTIAFPEEEVV